VIPRWLLALGVAAGLLATPEQAAAEDAYLAAHEEGFEIRYHPATRELSRRLLADLPSVRRELERTIGAPIPGLEVVIAARAEELLAVEAPIELSAWTAAGAPVDLSRALRRELARASLAGLEQPPPRWFVDAFADWFAEGTTLGTTQAMTVQTLTGRVPTLERLARLDEAECAGQCPEERVAARDLVRFLDASDAGIAGAVRALADGEPLDRALSAAAGGPIERLWHGESARRHGWLVALSVALVLSLVFGLRMLRRRTELRPSEVEDRLTEPRPRRRPRARGRSSARRLVHPAVVARWKAGDVPKVEHDGDWHTLH
jgi:hypothetical protein